MEPRRFDDISRALASGSSRRGVLRGMLGGLLAGALGRSRALAQDDCPGGKVEICHRTNSKKNPYNYISICSDSLADHLAHGDKYCEGVLVPDGECGCVCGLTAGDCAEGTEVNLETCTCDPICGDVVCRNLEVVDPDTCECVCPADDIVCGDGEVLESARCLCIPEADFCEVAYACDGGQAVCGSGEQFCGCFRTTEDETFCILHGNCGEVCTSSSECPENYACVYTCCGGEVTAFCQAPCGSEAAFGVFSDGPTTYPQD